MSASTTITVNVVDTLDPPPTFSEKSIYLVELNEGTSSAVRQTYLIDGERSH